MCNVLSSLSLPMCTSLGSTAFYSCNLLQSLSLPVCTTIGYGAVSSCPKLQSLSLPVCTKIYGYAFNKCTKLVSLYLTGSSLCTLSASTALSSTPIAGYTTSTGGVYGSIYVPASLLTAYQSATNWIYFSSRFVGI